MTIKDLAKINLTAFAKAVEINPGTLSRAVHKPIPGEIHDPDAINEAEVVKLMEKNKINLDDYNPDDFQNARASVSKIVPEIGEIWNLRSYKNDETGDADNMQVVYTTKTHVALHNLRTGGINALLLDTFRASAPKKVDITGID